MEMMGEIWVTRLRWTGGEVKLCNITIHSSSTTLTIAYCPFFLILISQYLEEGIAGSHFALSLKVGR